MLSSILFIVLFQTLIDRLNTNSYDYGQTIGWTLFQTLIDRLNTWIDTVAKAKLEQFQTLIDRLNTHYIHICRWAQYQISNPYR